MDRDEDELGEYDDEWYEDRYESDSQKLRDSYTGRDENGLLPCPFCGSPAKVFERDVESWNYPTYTEQVVKCSNSDCPVEPEARDEQREQAIKDWNTRYKETKMADNNEQDLEKIKERYKQLQDELATAWVQYNKWKDLNESINAQIAELNEQKKQYMVRVYQEVYFDFAVDAFDEQDAIAEATESAPYEDMEICDYFSSRPARFKVLCLKEDYKGEMEKNDDSETEKDK